MTSPNFRPEDLQNRLEYMFSPDQAAWIVAMEKRLAKLEGSAVKVEFDEPYIPVQVFEQKTLQEVAEMYPGRDENANCTDEQGRNLNDLVHREEPTKPRICPVTGMFLDEPEHEQYVYQHDDDEGTAGEYYPTNWGWKELYEKGLLFATPEDAERYAKYLKAMAKLRRLGKTEMDYVQGVVKYEIGQFKFSFEIAAYNQLTPEEQNALLWPNEEK